jgi:lambda family phage portal protein
MSATNRGLLSRARAAWSAWQGPKAVSRPSRMMAGSFAGGTSAKLYADFMASILSPDSEIRGDLKTMRARARMLVRDNAHAAGYVRELANQVIGPNGIMLQAKITKGDKQPAKTTNEEIERAWTEWGMPEHCTADGHDSWLDVQHLAIRSLPTDGEIILQKIPYFDNPFGFSVRFIDPDLLDESFNRPAARGVNEIRMGVELNEWGRPVAYWLWNRHPSDMQAGRLERKRIDASEIIHRFVRYRPNQTRGVTWFAPVLLAFKMVDGYQEAELVASRAAAVKWAAWVATDPEKAGIDMSKGDGTAAEMEMATGVVDVGPPGYDLRTFDPTHPNSAYDSFTTAIYRAISCGLGMAYTTFSGNLTAVNYSSIRAGVLSERDAYRFLQKWTSTHVCRPIYRDWLAMSLLHAALRVDSRLASNYYQVVWRGRGWPWVDPANDATAFETLRKNGLTSRQRACAERGDDFEEIADEIAYEEKYAASVGVDVSGTQPAGQPIERDDDESDETDDSKPNDRRALRLPRRVPA